MPNARQFRIICQVQEISKLVATPLGEPFSTLVNMPHGFSQDMRNEAINEAGDILTQGVGDKIIAALSETVK